MRRVFTLLNAPRSRAPACFTTMGYRLAKIGMLSIVYMWVHVPTLLIYPELHTPTEPRIEDGLGWVGYMPW